MPDLATLVQRERLSLLEDSFKTYVAPDIPRKKAIGAIAGYAQDISPEDILVQFDDTLWGGADNGLLLTTRSLYAHALMSPTQRIALADIRSIRAEKTTVLVNGAEFITLSMAQKITVLRFCTMLTRYIDSQGPSAPADPTRAADPITAKSPAGADVVPAAAAGASSPSQGFPRNRAETSYFFQTRGELIQSLLQDIEPDAAAMYLALYDTALAIATGLKTKAAYCEAMSWLVHDDEVLFQAYILMCFNVGQLMSEHIEDAEVYAFIAPLWFVMLSIGLKEQGQQPPTLARALDPMKALMGTPRMQEFKTCHDHYKAAYGVGQHGTSSLSSWFTLHCVDRLRQKYGTDFMSVQAACLQQGKDPQVYLQNYAEQLRPQVEAILIRYFSE